MEIRQIAPVGRELKAPFAESLTQQHRYPDTGVVGIIADLRRIASAKTGA